MSGGDLQLGKNPGATLLVLVWWLWFIAKGIMISNKIGRGRKADSGDCSKSGRWGTKSWSPGAAAGTLRSTELYPKHLWLAGPEDRQRGKG